MRNTTSGPEGSPAPAIPQPKFDHLELRNIRLRRIPRFYLVGALLLVVIGVWSSFSHTLLAKEYGDSPVDYLPSRAFSAEVFRSGSLPLWNPHIYSGMSHVAIVQTAPFYPLNILLYVPLPPVVAFNVSMVLHLLLLLGFAHAFFRLIHASEHAAWLGAVAFAFSGFLMLHLEAIGLFNSTVWIPAVFYCVERWIRTREWRFAAAGGVCLAFQLLAGWPQMVLLTVIYVAVYALSALPEERCRLQLTGGLIVAVLISAGLGAVEILPAIEFKPFSNLTVLPYSHFLSNSIAPQSYITLLFPYLLGADSTSFHRVPAFVPGEMLVFACYMGILPLLLAAVSLAFWRRTRYVRFGAWSVVIAIFLASVAFTPFAPFFYRVPVFNFFRDHSVNAIFLAFAIATLTSCAVARLTELTPELRSRLGWVIPSALVVTAALVLVKARAILDSMNHTFATLHPMWLWRLHQGMKFSNPDMIIAWMTILLAGLLFWVWMKFPASLTLTRIAIAFIVADLLWFGLSDQAHLSRGIPSPEENATYASLKSMSQGSPFRTMSLTPQNEFIRPNLNELAGIDDIYGYSALLPRNYADLLPVNVFALPHWRELLANGAILSLLNTRYILASGEPARSLESILASASGPNSESGDSTNHTNEIAPNAWTPLNPAKNFTASDPFECSQAPCGMQQQGLKLQKNSVYELRFTVEAQSKIADLHVIIAHHGWWQPLQSFDVSNVQLTAESEPYVNIYVTGPSDEFDDLRFSTSQAAPIRVSNVSLSHVGPVQLGEYREVAKHGDIIVVENSNALPRAFFVSKVTRVADYQSSRNQLWDPVAHFDPRAEALVENSPVSGQMGAGAVQRIEYRPNRVKLKVTCQGGCYLVLGDQDLPGWRAKIDDKRATIYTTDAVVRGIVVPDGRHEVEFEYRPGSALVGWWSVVITLMVVIVMTGHPSPVTRPER